MFKKSTVFILHFAPSLCFTLSLYFTPGPQSAVRSLRFTLTDFFITMPLTTKWCMLSFIIGYSANSLLQAF